MVGPKNWTFKSVVAWIALFLALALPISVLAQDMTLTLNAQPGTFAGKWVYRSFSISSKPGDTLAKLALGLNELEAAALGLPGRTLTVISRTLRPRTKPLRA